VLQGPGAVQERDDLRVASVFLFLIGSAVIPIAVKIDAWNTDDAPEDDNSSVVVESGKTDVLVQMNPMRHTGPDGDQIKPRVPNFRSGSKWRGETDFVLELSQLKRKSQGDELAPTHDETPIQASVPIQTSKAGADEPGGRAPSKWIEKADSQKRRMRQPVAKETRTESNVIFM
jgi:hypothetical protein